MRSLGSTALLAALLAFPGPVLAQGHTPSSPLPMTQPAPGTPSTSQRPSTAAGALGSTGVQAIDEDRARELLRSQGFGEVQEFTRVAGGLRARAMQDGRPVDVTVDAATGTIRSQSAGR